MILRVEPRDLEAELRPARALVTEAGLPALLARIDAGAFGTTPLNLEVLDAFSRALAAALAAAKLPQAAGWPSPYLGYLFAHEAVDRLTGLADGSPPAAASLPASQYGDMARAPAPDLLRALLRDCAGFLRFYESHADAGKRLRRDGESARCLLAYARLIGATLARLAEPPAGAEVHTPRLRLSGLRVSPAAAEEPSELLPVSFDDIVGNTELVKAGRRLARDIAGFDLAAGSNPKKVRNQVLFVLGSPGCGKTATAHAIGRYFLDLCARAKLPARMRVIRRTDWASAYQNQSASRLLEIFREEVFNAPGVCGVYWPDIDTAFAARSDADLRQEEKVNLATLFGILDGTIGPRNGRWFLLCDANNLRMDEATLSRLAQSPLRALGPETPDDFIRLLRDIKLRGKERWLPADPARWRALGERCVAEKLSGRSIDNLAGRVLTEIEDFDEPDDYFSLGFEEKRQAIERLSRPVSAERIDALITEHCRFEREAQERAERERFVSRVQEIRFHLSAQQAALQLSRDAAPEKG